MTTNEPARQPRFGHSLRISSVVLASALVAVVTHVVVAGLADGLDVPAAPGAPGTTTLVAAQSLAVGGVVGGAAMLVASLLLPRVTHAIRVTRIIGVGVLVLSLVPIVLAWSELASPVGLVVLHVVVGITVLLGLGWAMDDVATADD